MGGGLDWSSIDLFSSISSIASRSCKFLPVASYFVNVPATSIRTIIVDELSWNRC